MNIYTLTAVCTCPADKKPDTYQITIRSRRMLWTNAIGEAVAELSKDAIAQEVYTERLARTLKAQVETVGTHPAFVDESVCSHITITCAFGHP